MPNWYILFSCSIGDLNSIKQRFANSGYRFDDIDDLQGLSSASIESSKDMEEAEDTGLELLASINIAMRLSERNYLGADFRGVAHRRDDGLLDRRLSAKGTAFGITGAIGVGVPGSFAPPVRTPQERLVSLIQKNKDMASLTNLMTAQPLTFGSMHTVYESAKGFMSPRGKREDFQCLIDLGWLTSTQSTSLYETMGHYRHGFPRRKLTSPLMPYDEALQIIKSIFWHLVDHLEPQ
jgi:hypothetical protein